MSQMRRGSVDRYRIVFDSFDLDGSGDISMEEVQQAFAEFGTEIGDMDDLLEIMAAGDTTGTGSLNFEEFCKVMKSHENRNEASLEELPPGFLDSDDSDDSDAGEKLELDLDELFNKLIALQGDDDDVLHATSLEQHVDVLKLESDDTTMGTFKVALVEAALNAEDEILTYDDYMRIAQQHLPQAFLHDDNEQRIDDEPEDGSILDTIDPSILKRFREVFEKLDTDKDGLLDLEQVQEAMRQLGRGSGDERESFFTLMNVIGDGGDMSFPEFAAFMIETPETVASLARNVSRWQNKQTHPEQKETSKLLRSGISRHGLKRSVADQDKEIESKEKERLARINADAEAAYNSDVNIKSLDTMQLRKYQKVFNKLDIDQDGNITRDELRNTIEGVVKRKVSNRELDEFLGHADTDHSGTLDFDEFVTVMLKTKLRIDARDKHREDNPENDPAKVPRALKSKYRKTFELYFDLEKNGMITISELQKGMQRLGKCPSEKACYRIVSTVTKDDVGQNLQSTIDGARNDKGEEYVMNFAMFIRLMEMQAKQVRDREREEK